MERFTFPLLSPSQIFTQLKDSLRIPVPSEESITKPRWDTLKEIYSRLLQEVFHKEESELFKQKPQVLQKLQSSDLTESSTFTMTLFKHLSTLLSQIGCKADNFAIKDLLYPDSKRTRKFLSAIINFLKFMTAEQELLFDENSECTISRVAAEEQQRVQEIYEKLKRENTHLKKKKEKLQPIIQEKTQILAQLEKEKNAVLQEKKELENNCRKYEIEATALENAFSNLGPSLEVLQKEIQSSDDRMIEFSQDDIDKLYNLKEKYQEELQGNIKDTQYQELMEKFDTMQQVCSVIREAALNRELCENASEKLRELKHELNNCHQSCFELENQYFHPLHESPSKECEDNELANKTNFNDTNKRAAIEDIIARSKKEIEEGRKRAQLLDHEICEKTETLQKLEDELVQKEANHIAEIEMFAQGHSEVISRAELYKKQVTEMLMQSDALKKL